MIEIRNIKKSFGDQILYDHFSLTVEDGAMVMIFGASGCGKTTLLNMIGSIEPVDKGQILVDGVDITLRKNKQDYLRSKVGFLFQNFALVDGYTVWQNLAMVKKKNRSGISIEAALEKVGLAGSEKKKVYQLSGGEQQRVALARLMVKKCDIILADEPTGSLDMGNAERVMKILDDMRQMGKTLIIVTHSEQFISMATKLVKID